MTEKFITTAQDEADFRFDEENNVEPARTIAERLSEKYGGSPTHPLVDDVSHAIEDARELGERRGLAKAKTRLLIN